MRLLFFDTETTGKLVYSLPLNHPNQPHLVQLCAALQDASGEIVAEQNVIIRPDGWVIPKEASDIHRITDEMAHDLGVRLSNACFLFRDLMEAADVAVAHNIEFDIKVMTRALAEAEVPELPWVRIPQRCTMKTSTPIVKAPGPRGFKWPTLTETHKHFFGTGVEGAHNAMADTHACRRIHNKLAEIGAFGPTSQGVSQ